MAGGLFQTGDRWDLVFSFAGCTRPRDMDRDPIRPLSIWRNTACMHPLAILQLFPGSTAASMHGNRSVGLTFLDLRDDRPCGGGRPEDGRRDEASTSLAKKRFCCGWSRGERRDFISSPARTFLSLRTPVPVRGQVLARSSTWIDATSTHATD